MIEIQAFVAAVIIWFNVNTPLNVPADYVINVMPATQAQMCYMVHPGENFCKLEESRPFYHGITFENNVFIDQNTDLTTMKGQGILAHEILHAMINYNKGSSPAIDFECQGAEEHFVLKTQHRWLKSRGFNGNFEKMLETLGINKFFFILSTRCHIF